MQKKKNTPGRVIDATRVWGASRDFVRWVVSFGVRRLDAALVGAARRAEKTCLSPGTSLLRGKNAAYARLCRPVKPGRRKAASSRRTPKVFGRLTISGDAPSCSVATQQESAICGFFLDRDEDSRATSVSRALPGHPGRNGGQRRNSPHADSISAQPIRSHATHCAAA